MNPLMKMRGIGAVLLLVLGLAIPGSGDHVSLDELYPLAPWDALHTITDPQFHDELYVLPGEEVFGVSIGNESHTYPLKLMNYHEVINDVISGVPVVVSYCPLCGSAITYERTVDGKVLTFRTSGYLYLNNKVMFDAETGSLWPQILGEAINGTFHGARLRIVTTARMSYEDWMALHPEALLVGRPWGPVLCPAPCRVPPGFQGYEVNPYAPYQAGELTYAPIRSVDARLHPKTFVLGVVMKDDAWAITYPDLLERRAVNVQVGGVPIVVAASPGVGGPSSGDSVHVFRRGNFTLRVDLETNELVDDVGHRYSIPSGLGESGRLEPVAFFFGFWFAWHDHYPGTRLYGGASTSRTEGLEGLSIGVAAIAAFFTSVGLFLQLRRRRG